MQTLASNPAFGAYLARVSGKKRSIGESRVVRGFLVRNIEAESVFELFVQVFTGFIGFLSIKVVQK
ncbi:hypothetical protein KHO49_25715 [Pseudomonas sp. RC4D1]|uniref:hypothetical protein n=1 Tax=Pseudomonas sp. RC4D1 TaxID=2834407 RepID=UPI001BD10ACF|nr:hypothetical protein [Pseudomonas sp. RC4D1]MBS7561738.1 hypothetical protein [Pseudomonas sp. RC4D1]